MFGGMDGGTMSASYHPTEPIPAGAATEAKGAWAVTRPPASWPLRSLVINRIIT